MTESENKTKINIGYPIFILAVFTWSFSEIIVKLLQGRVGPLSLSLFRFIFGGLFLFGILLVKRDLSGSWKMIKDNWKLMLISSCIAFGISNIIYFVGVTMTKANIAATIYTTYPIWITIYSIFILDERSNLKLKFLGIAIGVIGVAILMTDFNFMGFFSSEYLLGNLLVLCGSLMWSLYSVLGKKIQLNEKQTSNCSLKYSTISSLLASLPIMFILPFTEEFNGFLEYDFESWFWIIFLGVVATGIGIYLLFEGLRYLEASKGFSLAFLKPIFATILAFFILGEFPTFSLLISISLVMISIILINYSPKNLRNNKNK